MNATAVSRRLNAMNRLTQRLPWLLRGSCNRAYRAIGRAGLFDADGFTRSFYGPWLRTAWDDMTFRFSATGFYGYVYADWIAALREPCVFLDIGANQGLYAVIAGANPAVKAVHAFEPNPALCERLRASFERNGLRRGEVHPVAVADRSGTLSFEVDAGHTGGGSLRGGIEGRGAVETLNVEAVDAEALEARLNLPEHLRIEVKIDVEGVEPTVIAQLRRTGFWPRVSSLFVEIDERWIDAEALLGGLAEEGFEMRHRFGREAGHYDVLMVREPTL